MLKYLRKSNCVFGIFGSANERALSGDNNVHYLSLDGAVLHSPIPQNISHALSLEFRELLPQTLLINQHGDIFSFQVSAKWIEAVARYIIGLAAFLSNNLANAESLFESLHVRGEQIEDTSPCRIEPEAPLSKIRNRSKVMLFETCLKQAYSAYNDWKATREEAAIRQFDYYLSKAKSVSDIRDDRIYLAEALCAFIMNRDIDTAIHAVKQCKNRNESTKYLNLAFLYAYKGDTTKAGQTYGRAASHTPFEDVLVEIEAFICWVMQEEPDKYQLHYCLGHINYRFKKDYLMAISDFKAFIENANSQTDQQAPSSILKCNTWGSGERSAILRGYGKTVQSVGQRGA